MTRGVATVNWAGPAAGAREVKRRIKVEAALLAYRLLERLLAPAPRRVITVDDIVSLFPSRRGVRCWVRLRDDQPGDLRWTSVPVTTGNRMVS